jgi:L-threonylcarbamoyladenylate synthase
LTEKPKNSSISVKTRNINLLNPKPDLIREAARVIRGGGVIVFPTRCLYGIGGDALNFNAVERVFAIKHRPYDKPILVLIRGIEELNKLVLKVPSAAKRLMECFWPGRVTIVFKGKDTLPDRLTAGTGKIGVRLPGHPVAAALLNELKRPITGTSANISGEAGCWRISDLPPGIVEEVDLLLDAGTLKGGTGSTVVDVTEDPPKILREGEVAEKEIFRAIGRQ